MDPNACYRSLVMMCASRYPDLDAAADAASVLYTWIACGGFLPEPYAPTARHMDCMGAEIARMNTALNAPECVEAILRAISAAAGSIEDLAQHAQERADNASGALDAQSRCG